MADRKQATSQAAGAVGGDSLELHRTHRGACGIRRGTIYPWAVVVIITPDVDESSGGLAIATGQRVSGGGSAAQTQSFGNMQAISPAGALRPTAISTYLIRKGDDLAHPGEGFSNNNVN